MNILAKFQRNDFKQIEAWWRICGSVNYVIIGLDQGLATARRQDVASVSAVSL